MMDIGIKIAFQERKAICVSKPPRWFYLSAECTCCAWCKPYWSCISFYSAAQVIWRV